MKAFEMIDVLKRAGKPRNSGITMVLDKGLGMGAAKDLMPFSDYIDLIKLGWGTPLLYPEELLKKKIKIYRDKDISVCNGGTLFEIAYSNKKIDEFLKYCKSIGFDAIEISDGSIEIKSDDRVKLIKKTSDMGFKVFSEVGKKDPKKDSTLTTEYRVDEAKMDLKAGAFKVIMESRESGKNIGIYDEKGSVKQGMAKALASKIGLKNIIFEAPEKSQQVHLILNFGPDVNLGNIKPDELVPLETLRRGLRGDTLGKLF